MCKGQSAITAQDVYACGPGSNIDRVTVSGQVFNGLVHTSASDGMAGCIDTYQYSVFSNRYLVSCHLFTSSFLDAGFVLALKQRQYETYKLISWPFMLDNVADVFRLVYIICRTPAFVRSALLDKPDELNVKRVRLFIAKCR
jgi:hypothetical protein